MKKAGSERPLMAMLLEVGPLVVFMGADALAGIFVATGVLVVAVVFSFALAWRSTQRLPIIPAVTLVFAVIFGALTLLLSDETFIKMETTFSSAFVGSVLLLGPLAGLSPLEIIFGRFASLGHDDWKKLTSRMGLFCILIAVLNELIWRNSSTEYWVLFRGAGSWILSAVFLASQWPILSRIVNGKKPANDSAAE